MTIRKRILSAIMNKIRRLERILTHVRSLNAFRINPASVRRLSTGKDSEGETKDSTSLESSGIEKEAQAKTEESTEVSGTEAKLSGFARSFARFTHIDDKEPEVPQTFASLIRHSKFVDVRISHLRSERLHRTLIDHPRKCLMLIYNVSVGRP